MKKITKIVFLNILIWLLTSNEVKAQFDCGTQITQEQQDYLNKSSRNKRNGLNLDEFSKKTTNIPIVAHIIQTYFGEGGLSQEDLDTSIMQLNNSFAPLNFNFESCGIKYIRHNGYFTELQQSFLKSSNEFRMADESYVEGAINIYFVPNPVNRDGNSTCGWAYFPGSSNDWLVISNNCAKNGSTLAHEIGHYFKLYHTHRGTSDLSKNEFVDGSNCGQTGIGDELCDTPAEPYFNEKERDGLDKCIDENCIYFCQDRDYNGQLYKPNTANIMSYSLKECRKTFSPDQIKRMQTSYLEDRKYLAKACSSVELNTCKARSKKALSALYNATDGANWTIKWDLSQPMETWHGVFLNDAGCVDSLVIFNNNLNGYLPPEIGDLEYLKYLFIAGNNLSAGVIPSEIGKLTKLKQLNLQRNRLEGGIPPEIRNLRQLEYFDLQLNFLSGGIPPEIGNLKSLTHLTLQANQFAGNLPVELTDLPNLRSLNIKRNNLTGCYEPELHQLCDQFIPYNYRISDYNNFNTSWENFCNTGAGTCICNRNADSLALVEFYNSTGGSNWNTTWNLEQPMDTWFGVGFNENGCVNTLALESNNLIGTIPPDIGNLVYLENFIISNSRGLTGNIPKEVGKLTNLKILKLSLNRLTGNIPNEIGNLYKLKTIDFDLNFGLTGSIPRDIGNLTGLKTIKVRGNGLTGSIPVEFSNLSYLNMLSLSYNQLEGCYNKKLKPICNYIGSLFYYKVDEGNFFDATWENFCNNDAGTCTDSQFQRGDFNNDGIVNNVDAMYLGLAYGNTGSACNEEDIINCIDWENEVNGVNSKYQDGDGNGLINEADLKLLNENYGIVTTSKLPEYKVQDFHFKLNQVSQSPNQMIFDLYVEDSKGQNIATHGLACSINFGVLPVTKINVDFVNSTLQPTITLTKFKEAENMLDIALSRTDKTNKGCDGAIASLIISINELEIDEDFVVHLLKPNAITATGIMSNGENSSFDSATIENRLGNIHNAYLSQNKPNPFLDESNIQYFIPEYADDAKLKIYNLTGNLLQTNTIEHIGTGHLNITSKNLKAGLYIYSLEINGEPIAIKRMIVL